MCGIIGYTGCQAATNSILIEGLHALEYRGYDSAGIAVVNNAAIQIIKAKGKVHILEDKLVRLQICNGTTGIAHTRWATHGEPSEENSHPHQSGAITLVHNGIIENHHILKEQLKLQGYAFYTDTDSEVACAYIDWCYRKCKNKQKALSEAYHQLEGSFAFVLLFADEPEVLYAMRKNSPLLLGVGENASYIASDISAFLPYTKRYIILEHEEIARCTKKGITIKNTQHEIVEKKIQISDRSISSIRKDGYAHYMLKEIYEEPQAVKQTIDAYMKTQIRELKATIPSLQAYKEIHIVACGSALYAGLIAKQLIEKKARLRVICQTASEYRYSDPLYDHTSLVIVISQSGETADTIAALQLAKQKGIDTLAIVNVAGSTIARMAKYVLYTFAGPEISVATTKAYVTQVTLLSLLTMKLAYERNQLCQEEIEQLQQELLKIPACIEDLLSSSKYKQAAQLLYPHEDVYYLGRGLDYALCMEGSLKLKEISYIHSEAYPAGELKHGTISLIEKGTPVIALITDPALCEKTLSNIKEVRARHASVLLLVREDIIIPEEYFDMQLTLPKVNPLLQGILSAIPLQFIAYETAKLRGCEIDQPRNLAKSVTVE